MNLLPGDKILDVNHRKIHGSKPSPMDFGRTAHPVAARDYDDLEHRFHGHALGPHRFHHGATSFRSTRIYGDHPADCGGLLLLPSVYYPLMRLRGKPALDSSRFLNRLKPAWWVLAVPPNHRGRLSGLEARCDSWLLLTSTSCARGRVPIAWMLYLAIRFSS